MSSTPYEIRRDLIRFATDIAMQNANNQLNLQTQYLDAIRMEYAADPVTYRSKLTSLDAIKIDADQVIKEAQKLNDFVSSK